MERNIFVLSCCCGGGAASNKSDPQRLAVIVLIIPGPFRNLTLTEFRVKRVYLKKELSMACQGVDNEVNDKVICGVDDDASDTTNESDEAGINQTNVERISDAMKLCRESRKEYNRKNYDNVFNITGETKNSDGIILMQLKY